MGHKKEQTESSAPFKCQCKDEGEAGSSHFKQLPQQQLQKQLAVAANIAVVIFSFPASKMAFSPWSPNERYIIHDMFSPFRFFKAGTEDQA